MSPHVYSDMYEGWVLSVLNDDEKGLVKVKASLHRSYRNDFDITFNVQYLYKDFPSASAAVDQAFTAAKKLVDKSNEQARMSAYLFHSPVAAVFLEKLYNKWVFASDSDWLSKAKVALAEAENFQNGLVS